MKDRFEISQEKNRDFYNSISFVPGISFDRACKITQRPNGDFSHAMIWRNVNRWKTPEIETNIPATKEELSECNTYIKKLFQKRRTAWNCDKWLYTKQIAQEKKYRENLIWKINNLEDELAKR